jgi:ABC-type multidrug transport system fused ATPase/permease subunit
MTTSVAAEGTSGSEVPASSESVEPPSLADLLELDALVESAFGEPTITAAAADAGLPYQVLRNHVLSRLDELDQIVAFERRQVANDEHALQAVQATAPGRDELPAEKLARRLRAAWKILGIGAIVALAAYVLAGFVFDVVIRLITVGAVGIVVLLVEGVLWFFSRRFGAIGATERETRRGDYSTARDGALERVRVSRELLTSAAVQKAIRPMLRQFVNARLANRYGVELAVDEAPGLAELEDPEFEIPTAAADRLRRLFQTMPGGSIGIAGPRGAGKTTLIRSFCSEREATTDAQPKRGFRVSAPVDYDARDFVLHMFATFCRTLGGTSAPFDDPRTESQSRDARILRRWVTRLALVIVPLFIGLGVWLILDGAVEKFSDTFPSNQILAGAILILIAMALAFVWRLQRFAEYREWRAEEDRREAAHWAAEGRREGTLEESASEWLRRIKFQQSYASGWSGSLKLPIGFQGGVDATSTMAQQQLTFPEIVAGFRELAGRAAVDYQVVIGIDELDKIESRDDAQSFLNDIKAVFGIERCFYLISVSEDAMANFERRGLPFRDAFDSALDEVVQVGFLELEDSMQLLKRRVVGMTVPFMALCHTLAGGLARDVIRYARTIIDTRDPQGRATLGAISTAVLRRELSAKLHAIVIDAQTADNVPSARADFLAWVHKLHVDNITASRLVEESRVVSTATRQAHTSNGAARSAKGETKLALLRNETACYMYFAATLLQFFNRHLDAARMQSAEQRGRESGGIEQLALARQRLGVDPTLAWRLLNSFRRHHGLTMIQPPRPPAVAAAEPTSTSRT